MCNFCVIVVLCSHKYLQHEYLLVLAVNVLHNFTMMYQYGYTRKSVQHCKQQCGVTSRSMHEGLGLVRISEFIVYGHVNVLYRYTNTRFLTFVAVGNFGIAPC